MTNWKRQVKNNSIKTTKYVSKVTFVSEPEQHLECAIHFSTHYIYPAKQHSARAEHMHSTVTCACTLKQKCTVSPVTHAVTCEHRIEMNKQHATQRSTSIRTLPRKSIAVQQKRTPPTHQFIMTII